MNELPDGLYERLITRELARLISELRGRGAQVTTAPLDREEAPQTLARHLARWVARAGAAKSRGEAGAAAAVELCNALSRALRENAGPDAATSEDDDVETPAELLRAVWRSGQEKERRLPSTPLARNALFTNAPDEPRLARELAAELDSADRVALICAFVRWEGLRLLEEPIQRFARRVGREGAFRLITTTYLGATERRALDALRGLGVDVKVCYETRTTRLHAKAWLFERDTGYSTVWVGSSNLSRSALLDGLEWNLRIAEDADREIVEKFRGTFDGYWESDEFRSFDSDEFERLSRQERRTVAAPSISFARIDVRPYPFQQRILDALEAEREVHDRWHSLVVAATGTGKTVVAALDYRRLRSTLADDRLLFVAHRKEILEQSLATFRAVLRDGSFGELLVAGERPVEGRHVFASIQSLHRRVDAIDPRAFDVVIVDEFHHSEAPTYVRLLDRLEPRVLLGLTATPERADDRDVTVRFGGRITYELRLWDALEEGLLCPFHYFGVHDGVDLRAVGWTRGGYDADELERIYDGNDARVALILEQLRQKVDPSRMRALGFCVSVAHARFMAERFRGAGIDARALSAETPAEEREAARRDLAAGRVRALFVVDLFNEGVDIPEVDTVLFLRPTESVTVFLQQLGRGLRHADGKACLTVLDFIGLQNRSFRFVDRFRGILGGSRRAVAQQIEDGFPTLPAGCHLALDRVARTVVLDSVRSALPSNRKALVAELRHLGDVSLEEFLRESTLEPEELWRKGGKSPTGWSALRRDAGLETPAAGPDETVLSQGVARLLHLDDAERIRFLRAALAKDTPPEPARLQELDRRRLELLHSCLRGRKRWPSLEASLADLWAHPAIRAELVELLAVLDDRVDHVTRPLGVPGPVPIAVHASYSLGEILAAFGESTAEKPLRVQAGVLFSQRSATDLLFVTLRKSEREFSPTTMYRDYAISPRRFHWESQSTTTERSPSGQRYVRHVERGSHVVLFARHDKKLPAGRTCPYVCLGRAFYERHVGERPMAITWRLEHELPPRFYQESRLAVG